MEMNCSGIYATNNLTFDKCNLYLNPFHETEIQPKNARFKSHGKRLLTCKVHCHILRSPEHKCPTPSSTASAGGSGRGGHLHKRRAPRGWPPSNSHAVFWVTPFWSGALVMGSSPMLSSPARMHLPAEVGTRK